MLNIYKLFYQNKFLFEKIDSIIENNGKIALFGAGAYGTSCINYMLENRYNVVCFVDNDFNKHGKYISGIPIVSYKNIPDFDVILITSNNVCVIKEIIHSLPNNELVMSLDQWFLLKNIENIVKLETLLYDYKSINTLKTLIYSKISTDNTFLCNIFTYNQYFCIPEFTYSNPNEIFFDAGAYVGDTIDNFLMIYYGIFKKIFAFEPGTKQFHALQNRISRLTKEWGLNTNDIILEKSCISNYNGEVSFNETSQMAINSITNNNNNNNKIKVQSIDNFLNGEKITFLKADIEGEEVNMLKGAIKTIKKYKPKMAISVYHRPDHMFIIPAFIKELVPEYNLALRHHSMVFAETTLYCWVNNN